MVHHILVGSLLNLLTTSAHAAGTLVAIKGLKWGHRLKHSHIGRVLLIYFLALIGALDSIVSWCAATRRGAVRRRAPAHAIQCASSSKERCALGCPRSLRWARLPRPPLRATSRRWFCHLAKRFPGSAFPGVLIPMPRDPVSCDAPYLPDSHRNLRFSIPTASTT